MRTKFSMNRKAPVNIEIFSLYICDWIMESIKLYSNRVLFPTRFGFVKYKPEVMIVCNVGKSGIWAWVHQGHSGGWSGIDTLFNQSVPDHTRPSHKNWLALIGGWSGVWCECSLKECVLALSNQSHSLTHSLTQCSCTVTGRHLLKFWILVVLVMVVHSRRDMLIIFKRRLQISRKDLYGSKIKYWWKVSQLSDYPISCWLW